MAKMSAFQVEGQIVGTCNSCGMWGYMNDNGTFRECQIDKLHHSLSESCSSYKERKEDGKDLLYDDTTRKENDGYREFDEESGC